MLSFNSFLAHPATPKSVNLEDKGEWNFQTMHAICPCMVWKSPGEEQTAEVISFLTETIPVTHSCRKFPL